ncbi:hypothetical protein SZ00_06108 (plasmid) [Rhodococcus sp. AD45]|nr:hypothetical protein SZ00_06108 [Rhodococcus sp. AD45]
MDEARLRTEPGQPLYGADDLIGLDADWVESVRGDFLCPTPSCDEARAIPVLKRTPPNRYKPHFRFHTAAVHLDDCPHNKTVTSSTADGGVPTNPNTGQSTYPSRLLRRAPRVISPAEGEDSQPATETTAPRRTRGPGSTHVDHDNRQGVYTIRRLCQTYINYPQNRADMIIDVPEITDTNSYQYAFKKLKMLGNTAITREPRQRIFLAPLRIFNHTEESPGAVTVHLHAGTDDKKYRVIINLEDSTKGEIRSLRTALDNARGEAEDNYRANVKETTWVFFIGNQDSEELAAFHVTDTTRICFITGTIIYPKRTR